jgi:hypothetical protein
MKRQVAAMMALSVTLVPATVLGQAASPQTETQLQQEMRHRRVIVRPLTPADEVQRDVDSATTEIEQQGREQAVVRDLNRPAQRSPQTDQDLKGGIQTRSLNNLLRR